MAHKIDFTTIDLMPYATSRVTAGTATATTKGGITTITLNITMQSSTTGDQQIFNNLPASIRPNDTPAVFAAVSSTGVTQALRARVSDIVFRFSSTSAITVYATATFISE